MKRKIAALFVLATMVFAFAGCGNTKNIPNTDNSRMIEQAGPATEGLLDKVLVDTNNIKIIAHEITFEEGVSADVLLKITNGTDKDLYFQTENESVNDCMVKGYLSEIVEAGTEKDVPLRFYDRNLSQYGIKNINKIDFNFYIVAIDTSEEYMTSDPVYIKLESKGDAVTEDDDSNGNVLYEENGIRIVELLGDELYTKDDSEYKSVIRIENNTESEIIISTNHTHDDDINLNARVPAGKISVVDARLHNMDEENAISKTDKLEAPEKTVEVSFTIRFIKEPIQVNEVPLTMRSKSFNTSPN